MSSTSTPPEMVKAPAKLTLSLRITGLRSDGFHFLDARMTTLQLHDELFIDPHGSGLSFGGPFATGLGTDSSNLIAQALRFVGTDAHITVTKNIPHGAGLGGGSADAAAVLRWAGRNSASDVIAAAALGSDVPFCVIGGHAHVAGIGEIVTPLAHIGKEITLIIPPLHVSTPAVYRAWDELGGPRGDGPNDLEPAAVRVQPELAMWRDRVREVIGRAPVLAGSGATWFLENLSADQHQTLRAALPEAHVLLTRTEQ